MEICVLNCTGLLYGFTKHGSFKNEVNMHEQSLFSETEESDDKTDLARV